MNERTTGQTKPSLDEVIKFLLGESELDGLSFGDSHPVYMGQNWWRVYLRAAQATPQPQTVRGALKKAVRLCDEEGGKLQTDDKSHDYWMGVGDTVTACENSIRALIEPLSAADEHQKAVRDLVTYGQSFMVGDKHVPLSDVLLSAATGWQGENAMLTKEKPNELISALKQAYLVIYKLYEHYDSSEKSYGFAETLATIDKALANYATHSGVAVQEPVYQVVTGGGGWIDTTEYFYNLHPGNKRILYYSPTLDKE